MPRKKRFFLPGVAVHVVQRGHRGQAIFSSHDTCRCYLDWLKEAALIHGCQVHAYCQMTDHVHLLVTPMEAESVSLAIQALGRRFVPYFNQAHGRLGPLWEGRFKANSVQEEIYLLECYRYIELNPVRAGAVAHPANYPWSSCRANALGESDPLLTPHALYRSLGETTADRLARYRALLAQALDTPTLRAIRDCLQTGTPLGNERFREEIEKALGVRVGYARRGRPRRFCSALHAPDTGCASQSSPLSSDIRS